jgi:fucose 4-O-acetylase-like acetyltransferase
MRIGYIKAKEDFMSSEAGVATMKRGNRLFWLDNLRTFMIFLVIMMHAGIVYESSGINEFISWIVVDPSTNDVSGIMSFIVFDIFIMATLFLVAGFVTPPSVDRKQGWNLVVSRLKRLILPWLFAVLVLIPLYKVIYLYARSLPQENLSTYFHFSSPSLTGQNWLWFLPLLFVFNVVYFLLSKLNISLSSISFRLGAAIAFVIILIYSIAMDILGLRGWTLTALIDFQNERLLIYFVIFLLGALAFRQNLFAEKPKTKGLYLGILPTVWIPILAFTVLSLAPLLNPGNFFFSASIDRFILWLSFTLSLLGLIYLMVETFWRYVDRTGRIWNELNKNSYGVYIIHMIVLGVIALPLVNFAMPSLLKYLTLTVLTFLVSNLIISLYRRAVDFIRTGVGQPTAAPEMR